MNTKLFEKELTKRIGAGMTEALLRKCQKKKQTVIDFLIDFIDDNADDEFYDMMFELCDEYGLQAFDDEDYMDETIEGK